MPPTSTAFSSENGFPSGLTYTSGGEGGRTGDIKVERSIEVGETMLLFDISVELVDIVLVAATVEEEAPAITSGELLECGLEL